MDPAAGVSWAARSWSKNPPVTIAASTKAAKSRKQASSMASMVGPAWEWGSGAPFLGAGFIVGSGRVFWGSPGLLRRTLLSHHALTGTPRVKFKGGPERPAGARLRLRDQSLRRLAAPPEPELKKGWPFEKDQPCEVSDKPSCSLPSLNRFSCHWRRRSPWPCSRGLRHRRPYRRSFRRQRPCLGRGGNALRQSGSRLR